MKAILKEGLEAALRANPEVLEKCKPRTGVGLFVRGLVLEAGKGKTTSLRTLMSLVEWESNEEDGQDDPDGSLWDWSPDGVWETMPEAEPEQGEAREEVEGPAKKELRRRINRLIEAGDHERVAAIMEAARSGTYGEPAALP
jgi:hypothetical protein